MTIKLDDNLTLILQDENTTFAGAQTPIWTIKYDLRNEKILFFPQPKKVNVYIKVSVKNRFSLSPPPHNQFGFNVIKNFFAKAQLD